ncbi:phospholipid-transporting ATPase ABCA1 [Pimephales promelas]|uniref:phospholipid-transporting ATPase ABCA1 n=1 Tax=Pimephales promelas TaxID=90988 RepID=UPI0019559DEB|nr:phospholipid-transporting ATPase ABCA1 [Pimephales promelas]
MDVEGVSGVAVVLGWSPSVATASRRPSGVTGSVVEDEDFVAPYSSLRDRLSKILWNGRLTSLSHSARGGGTLRPAMRFGEGYTLIVRACADQTDICVVESFVRDTFPGSTLKEKHHNTLQYQIPQGEGTLAHIFSQLTKHQQMLRVEDYSVSQTTLDQVFVNFARQQRDEEDGVFENVVDLSDEIQISAT